MRNIRELQKNEALRRLNMIGVIDSVKILINKFDELYYSEYVDKQFPAVLYWATREMNQQVKEFEEKTGSLVYHIILNNTEFGDMVSFLYVSKYQEEWELERNDIKRGQTLAYVINQDIEESGYIGIKPAMGGIQRIW